MRITRLGTQSVPVALGENSVNPKQPVSRGVDFPEVLEFYAFVIDHSLSDIVVAAVNGLPEAVIAQFVH